jgi:hypothetical protein
MHYHARVKQIIKEMLFVQSQILNLSRFFHDISSIYEIGKF